jgi:hypothetical protein
MADGALIFFRSGRIGEKEMAICGGCRKSPLAQIAP